MRAVSSMATRHMLADLAAAAAATGLANLEVVSMGGVDAARRIAAGEQVDLAFLARDALHALADVGHLDPESVTDLVVSQVAAAVRAPASEVATRPSAIAFADAAGMRAAIRSARRIGYSTGPSGIALVAMIERWGLQDLIGTRLVEARPGVPVAALLAAGEVELGFQQLSELVGQRGVSVLGVLPEDCAIETVFAGAVSLTSTDAAAAWELLEFFASSESTATAYNFRPAGRRR